MRIFIIYTKVLENTTVHIDLLFFSVDSSSRSLIVQLFINASEFFKSRRLHGFILVKINSMEALGSLIINQSVILLFEACSKIPIVTGRGMN